MKGDMIEPYSYQVQFLNIMRVFRCSLVKERQRLDKMLYNINGLIKENDRSIEEVDRLLEKWRD